MFTATEAYDQNVLGDASAPIQQSLERGGMFTELTAEMNYRATGRRVQFASTGGTDFRYYSDQDRILGVGHHAGAGMTIALSPQASVVLNQTAAYSPSYLYGLFAAIASPGPGQVNTASNYAVNDNPSYNYATDVTLTQHFGARNTFAAHVGGQYVDFVHSTVPAGGISAFRDLLSYDAGGTFTHGLSRDLRFTLGYTFRRVEYLDGSFPTEHDVNVGVEYTSPPLEDAPDVPPGQYRLCDAARACARRSGRRLAATISTGRRCRAEQAVRTHVAGAGRL